MEWSTFFDRRGIEIGVIVCRAALFDEPETLGEGVNRPRHAVAPGAARSSTKILHGPGRATNRRPSLAQDAPELRRVHPRRDRKRIAVNERSS